MATKRNGRGLLDRPLSARSVMASLLLGMHPPRLAGSRLVRWCGAFGIAEGTARVALSRMVDRGELRASGGVYELVGPVRSRQRAQDWSLTPALEDWDGEWRMAAVGVQTARDAAERAALRDAMRRLRYVESREGLWVRPDNLPRVSGPKAAWETAGAQCDWWRAVPDEGSVRLASRLFRPEKWAARATVLHEELAASTDALRRAGDEVLAQSFEVGAATLAHVRADPLLPAELCPHPWPGAGLRETYLHYQRAFGGAVRAWFRTAA